MDLKFINNGDGTAYITGVDIEVLSSKINKSPNLILEYNIENGNIVVYAKNLGWGIAKIKEAFLNNSVLENITNQEFFETSIPSGECKKILKLELKNDHDPFQTILAKKNKIFSQISNLLELKDSSILNNDELNRYLSEHEKWHIEEFFENLKAVPVFETRQEWHIKYFQKEPFQRIPVNELIIVQLAYFDENDNKGIKEFKINKSGTLWYTENGFEFDSQNLMFKLRQPEDIYVVLLNPETSKNKKYNISHYIKSGEVERLHFLFASEKTAEYTVRFIFHFNKKGRFQSDLFNLSLYAENRKDYHYDNIKDGNHLIFKNGELELK